MRLRSIHIAVLVLVAIFGTIGVTTLTGNWITESTRVPRVIETGDYAGSSDPADIRGSYTFGDVEEAFGVPARVLARAFGLPASGSDVNPAAYAVKDLEEIYGESADMEVGTDSIRLFVSLYTGVPYEPEETTALPAPAYEILLTHAGLLSETEGETAGEENVLLGSISAFENRVVDLPGGATETTDEDSTEELVAGAMASSGTTSEEAHETSTEEGVIKGQTTFADLLNWGLTREQVEEVIGGSMPARATNVRDYAAEVGASFGTYRETFQQLLDARE